MGWLHSLPCFHLNQTLIMGQNKPSMHASRRGPIGRLAFPTTTDALLIHISGYDPLPPQPHYGSRATLLNCSSVWWRDRDSRILWIDHDLSHFLAKVPRSLRRHIHIWCRHREEGRVTPKADKSTDNLRECDRDRGGPNFQNLADVICTCPLRQFILEKTSFVQWRNIIKKAAIYEWNHKIPSKINHCMPLLLLVPL